MNQVPKTHTFNIDKGMPIPPRLGGREPGTTGMKYPFADLAVGDSFFVPNVTYRAFSGLITYAAKKLGRVFTSRISVEDNVRGIRVWRVS